MMVWPAETNSWTITRVNFLKFNSDMLKPCKNWESSWEHPQTKSDNWSKKIEWSKQSETISTDKSRNSVHNWLPSVSNTTSTRMSQSNWRATSKKSKWTNHSPTWRITTNPNWDNWEMLMRIWREIWRDRGKTWDWRSIDWSNSTTTSWKRIS